MSVLIVKTYVIPNTHNRVRIARYEVFENNKPNSHIFKVEFLRNSWRVICNDRLGKEYAEATFFTCREAKAYADKCYQARLAGREIWVDEIVRIHQERMLQKAKPEDLVTV